MSIQRNLFTGEVIEDRGRRLSRARKLNGHAWDSTSEQVKELVERITSLEATIAELRDIICHQNQTAKESYNTAEVANILGKRPYTVREWCRLQRINAYKAMCGRGCEVEWRVTREELLRIQNEGLLPIPNSY